MKCLRCLKEVSAGGFHTCKPADTIESLRQENAALKALVDHLRGEYLAAQASNKVLREALEECLQELSSIRDPIYHAEYEAVLATPDDTALKQHDAALLRKVAEKLARDGYPAAVAALLNEVITIERGEG